MKKILLSIGNLEYEEIIRNRFSEHDSDFIVLEQEVMHFQFLEEIIEIEKPDIIMLHDYYLPTHAKSDRERETAWINLISMLREEYDDLIRIVFLCERERGDPFLNELVNNNVLDIFSDNTIDLSKLIEQLKDRPRFSRVAKYRITAQTSNDDIDQEVIAGNEDDVQESSVITDEDKEHQDKEQENKNKKGEKKEKPVVTKVVEKKVKVVNKQVVKRDYSIQVMNQVEKVVGVPIDKKLIMIGSPFPRSGSTFISHLLARELTKIGVSTTYIENPYTKSYTYDRFIGHEYNPKYRSLFYQYAKESKPNESPVYDWQVEDINMIVKNPSHEPIYRPNDIPFDKFIKVLLSSQTTVTILDVGTGWNNGVFKDIFDIATDCYFIIEPDISNIQFLEDPDNPVTSAYRNFISHEKSTLIGNRFEKKMVNYDIFKDLYEGELDILIPEFPSKNILSCQYEGTFINDNSFYKDVAAKAIDPILNDILPKEFLKKQAKKGSLFRNIFSRKISIQRMEDQHESKH